MIYIHRMNNILRERGVRGGEMGKSWFCKVLKGSTWISQSKGQFDMITTVYSPIGALVWLCGHVVCSFVFCFFWFSRFWPSGADHAKTSKIQKNKKTKLQTTCPQSQTFAPMGSDFFVFSRFLHGLLCCILLLSHQIALYSAKSM